MRRVGGIESEESDLEEAQQEDRSQGRSGGGGGGGLGSCNDMGACGPLCCIGTVVAFVAGGFSLVPPGYFGYRVVSDVKSHNTWKVKAAYLAWAGTSLLSGILAAKAVYELIPADPNPNLYHQEPKSGIDTGGQDSATYCAENPYDCENVPFFTIPLTNTIGGLVTGGTVATGVYEVGKKAVSGLYNFFRSPPISGQIQGTTPANQDHYHMFGSNNN